MANVLFWGKDEGAVRSVAQSFWEVTRACANEAGLLDWDILSPVPCAFERIRDDWRWHMVVKCPLGKDISAFLADVQSKVAKVRGASIAIDIDPLDLL